MVRSSEPDELEILISRFAAGDDTLTADERLRVESELDRGAEAHEMLAGEHRLTELLRTADPLPSINYELLAARISANIPQTADRSAAIENVRPATAARSFWSMPQIALAASVLIATGVAVPLVMNDRGSSGPAKVGGQSMTSNGTGSPSVAVTTIRAVDGGESLAKSQPVGGATNVTVGPSPSLAGRPTSSRYGLGPTSNPQPPSRVVISPESESGTTESPLSPR